MGAKFACLAACCAVVVVLAGCGPGVYTETSRENGICAIVPSSAAPKWVSGGMPSDGTYTYVIGRGVGYTTLDERGAFNAAMDDARQQLALTIFAQVTASGAGGDQSKGIGWHPAQKWSLPVDHQAAMVAKLPLSGLVAQEVYWENWQVTEPKKPFDERNGSGYRRYKCWVKAGIKTADFDHATKVAWELIEKEARRPSEDIEYAKKVREQDKAIAREDMLRREGQAREDMLRRERLEIEARRGKSVRVTDLP